MSELVNLVKDLNQAFDQFRNAQDKRYEDFANDMQKINDRIDNLELDKQQMGSNPGLGSGRMSEDEREYKEGFFNYLKRGQNALPSNVLNTLSVGSAPDGGFWVPASTSNAIITKVHESSNVRKLATAETIGTDRLEIPKDLDEGTVGGWVGETETRSDTATPEVGVHEIPVHEQYAMPKTTQKFLDDCQVVEAETWLVSKIVKRIVKDENASFVTGNGVMRPRGFTDYDTSADEDDDRAWGVLQHINTGASGGWLSASSGSADALIQCIFKLKEEYHEGAVWAMNRFTMASVATLKDEDGRYLLGTARLQDRFPFELLGFGVQLMSGMPNIGANSLSIAFGNFKEGYRIVDHRRGLTVLRDPFTSKGWVKFYATKRTGGSVVNSEALKFIRFGTD